MSQAPFGPWTVSVPNGREVRSRIEQVFVARPTGVGRGITTYAMPIDSRDEWLAAAARHLA
jgi:hypothetical protein